MTDYYFRPHPDALYSRLTDTEAALLGLKTSQFYTLNETGIRIWETVQGGANLAGIAEALEQEYEVTHEEAVACTATFLEQLLQENLIVKEERR